MLRAIRNIDYIILLCEDVARMRAFYRDVMQFPLEEDERHWVKFRVGSGFLTLRPRGRHYDGPGVKGGASVQLAFRVAPSVVELCHKELLSFGAEILEPPKDQEFGHRTLYFRDPEGNVLEIYAEL